MQCIHALIHRSERERERKTERPIARRARTSGAIDFSALSRRGERRERAFFLLIARLPTIPTSSSSPPAPSLALCVSLFYTHARARERERVTAMASKCIRVNMYIYTYTYTLSLVVPFLLLTCSPARSVSRVRALCFFIFSPPISAARYSSIFWRDKTTTTINAVLTCARMCILMYVYKRVYMTRVSPFGRGSGNDY